MSISKPAPAPERRDTFAHAGALFFFFVFALASAFFVFAYWVDWGTRWLGFAMGTGLLAFGVGLVVVAHRVLPHGTYVEDRPPLTSAPEEQLALELDFTRGGELGRRKFLWLGLAGGLAAFGIAAIAPIRSFGPRPDSRLFHSPWRRGLRVVDDAGRPVRAADVPVGGSMTVFPDGYPNSPDGQAMLVRVGDDVAATARTKPTNGIYVYSKVCTHVGCPVGQYLAQRHELMCPCHQSVFDVLDGAKPTFGPAGRRLPALPIHIGADGVIVADGDFDAPVGPSFWNLS